MTTYAEVSAEGVITKVFENNGETYTPADGAYVIESSSFIVGQRYEPSAGNTPLAYTVLNATPKTASTDEKPAKTSKKAPTDGTETQPE